MLDESLPSDSIIITYTFAAPHHQNFAFPAPMMRYIIFHPYRLRVLKKLYLCCKYFFSKNPLLIVGSIQLLNEKCICEDGSETELNLNELSPKIWLWQSLYINSTQYFLSIFISKIERCNLSELYIYGQELAWNEFKILTAFGWIRRCELDSTKVTYSDGSIVPFDKLLVNLLNVVSLNYAFSHEFSTLSVDSVKNFVQILLNMKRLTSCKLRYIPETFDFNAFTEFLLKNKANVFVSLIFSGGSQEYKNIVKNFIKKMPEISSCRVPLLNI